MATIVIASCWMFIVAKSATGAAMAGAMMGLAALTRTMALPLVALAALLLLRERRPRAALAFTAAALAVFAPYAIRNYSLNGAILPTRTGVNLLVSNSEYTQAVVPKYHADLLEDYAESLLVRDGIGSERGMTPSLERQQDVALTRHAWADMKRRPIELLSLRPKYAFYFLGPFLIPYQAPGDEAAIQLEPGGRARVTGYLPRPLWERAVYTLSVRARAGTRDIRPLSTAGTPPARGHPLVRGRHVRGCTFGVFPCDALPRADGLRAALLRRHRARRACEPMVARPPACRA